MATYRIHVTEPTFEGHNYSVAIATVTIYRVTGPRTFDKLTTAQSTSVAIALADAVYNVRAARRSRARKAA